MIMSAPAVALCPQAIQPRSAVSTQNSSPVHMTQKKTKLRVSFSPFNAVAGHRGAQELYLRRLHSVVAAITASTATCFRWRSLSSFNIAVESFNALLPHASVSQGLVLHCAQMYAGVGRVTAMLPCIQKTMRYDPCALLCDLHSMM